MHNSYIGSNQSQSTIYPTALITYIEELIFIQ